MNFRDLVFEKIGQKLRKFLYPDAEKNTHPGVRKAIEDFRDQPESIKLKTPLLYWILKKGTPDFKMDPSDADYVDKSTVENQYCGNCQFTYCAMGILNLKDFKLYDSQSKKEPRIICSQIKGDIKLPGWCRLWKKAEY